MFRQHWHTENRQLNRITLPGQVKPVDEKKGGGSKVCARFCIPEADGSKELEIVVRAIWWGIVENAKKAIAPVHRPFGEEKKKKDV
jgi:hypothetical protein